MGALRLVLRGVQQDKRISSETTHPEREYGPVNKNEEYIPNVRQIVQTRSRDAGAGKGARPLGCQREEAVQRKSCSPRRTTLRDRTVAEIANTFGTRVGERFPSVAVPAVVHLRGVRAKRYHRFENNNYTTCVRDIDHTLYYCGATVEVPLTEWTPTPPSSCCWRSSI